MEYNKTNKNTVKRGFKKASYNKDKVHAILDACEICNVAFSIEGSAYVQPINFGREGENIYLHGSHKNRMTNAVLESGTVCLSVTLLDSMKLSRSAFHHSVNYRSVVVFGKARELHDEEDKLRGLRSIINHFVPDRWENSRLPNEKELKATKVIEITIETASAKIANGEVEDKDADKELDLWAGQIPIRLVCDYPIPEKDLREGMEIPKHVIEFYEKNKNGF